MKTSTTLLIAAGAVLAVVGIGSAVYADSGWRGHAMRGPGDCGPLGAMLGPIVIKRVFDLADTDADGKLTQAEIDAARASRFDAHDADADGRLTLAEFEVLFQDVTRPVSVRAFQFLDPDGDAQVTRAEFDRPGARMVQMLDRNGDGALSLEDRREGFRFGRHDDN